LKAERVQNNLDTQRRFVVGFNYTMGEGGDLCEQILRISLGVHDVPTRVLNSKGKMTHEAGRPKVREVGYLNS